MFFTLFLLFLPSQKGNTYIMIIVPIKENEPIDKALKKFKKKFERTGVVRELRRRQTFEKKSVTRRQQVLRAKYRTMMQRTEEA